MYTHCTIKSYSVVHTRAYNYLACNGSNQRQKQGVLLQISVDSKIMQKYFFYRKVCYIVINGTNNDFVLLLQPRPALWPGCMFEGDQRLGLEAKQTDAKL